jgi:hypothetical protein
MIPFPKYLTRWNKHDPTGNGKLIGIRGGNFHLPIPLCICRRLKNVAPKRHITDKRRVVRRDAGRATLGFGIVRETSGFCPCRGFL